MTDRRRVDWLIGMLVCQLVAAACALVLLAPCLARQCVNVGWGDGSWLLPGELVAATWFAPAWARRARQRRALTRFERVTNAIVDVDIRHSLGYD